MSFFCEGNISKMENAVCEVSTWNFANYLIMAYYWLSVVSNSNSKHKKPLFVVWDFSMAIFEKSQVFTGSGTTIYFNPYLGTLPYHLLRTVIRHK